MTNGLDGPDDAGIGRKFVRRPCGTGPLATPAAPFGCREIPYRSVPGINRALLVVSVVKRLLRVTGLRPKNHDSAIAYKSSTHYHELRSAHARTPLPVLVVGRRPRRSPGFFFVASKPLSPLTPLPTGRLSRSSVSRVRP